MTSASPTRRTFLSGAAGLALAGPRVFAEPRRQEPSAAAEPLFRISLAEWSLHRMLQQGNFAHLSFPSVVRRAFDLSAVEYVSTFFEGRARDRGYLRELEQMCAHTDVRSLLIMVDGEGALAHEDDAQRAQAIRNHHKWVVAAWVLGCHSIRVNAAGSGEPERQQERAAAALRELATYADAYGIDVIVENHGGLSSNGKWLAGVMQLADHPRVGTLPDFGNFRISATEEYDRYEGVRELMPWAKAVSAKSHEFDENGDEVHTDYRRMMRIVLEAGYRGYVGIEYEGGKHSEPEGVQLTKALLERVREELAPEFVGK